MTMSSCEYDVNLIYLKYCSIIIIFREKLFCLILEEFRNKKKENHQ